jgi:RNA polymerase sigma-70 factor (ECF subfamily)
MPDDPECHGLLALLLSTRARMATRTGLDGMPILLADADRSAWDGTDTAEAIGLLERTLKAGRPGPFQIRAAISCLHSHAPSIELTDWPQIVQLYDVLLALQPSSIVAVNRAVAVAEVHGPAVGLAALDAIDDLPLWHMYHAARADLLTRLGDASAARDALLAALACPHNDPDDRLLRRRLAAIDCGG